jgi:predicted proteasome-type protease
MSGGSEQMRLRSNVTVGTPFDLLLYERDSVEITRNRRVSAWTGT